MIGAFQINNATAVNSNFFNQIHVSEYLCELSFLNAHIRPICIINWPGEHFCIIQGS